MSLSNVLEIGDGRVLAFALLVVCAPSLQAQAAAQPAPTVTSAPAEDHAAEFKVLDIDITRFDGLLERFNDPVNKVTIFAYRNLLKSRVDDLRGGFDQAKYDELRYDINLQCQRLANWLAAPRTPPRAIAMEARQRVSISKLQPSPDNPAEIKAALGILDDEIRRVGTRISALVIGSAEHASATRR